MRRQMLSYGALGAGVGFVYVALLVTTATCLYAQEKPVANPPQPTDSTPPAKRDYRFEVASIRPAGPPTGYKYGDPRLRPQYSPGLYREEQVSLAHLAGEAFGVKHGYQIENPRWMDTAYFTLSATPPDGTTKMDIPVMLKHLLEDRFGLKYHHETRRMSGYELVVAKSGPGLTKSPAPASQRTTAKGPPVEIGTDGKLHLSKDGRPTELWSDGYVQWRGRNETMKQLAGRSADTGKLNAPVLDATGLEGEYDFLVSYTPDSMSAGGDEASKPTEHPSLRDALQEQLGLKLQPLKDVPVDVIVIDSANKEPTEN